jgi:predicted MFS family arabinose efflux permease
MTAPDALRGRMMSLYAFVFVGSTPFGALFIGAVAERFGVPAACAGGGGLGLLGVLLLAWRWRRRAR